MNDQTARMSINTYDYNKVKEELISLLKKTNKNKRLYGVEIVNHMNKSLSLKMKLTESKLRGIINKLRQDSYPIMSSSDGYWYSLDKEEIGETIASLTSRCDAINAAIIGLKNCLK